MKRLIRTVLAAVLLAAAAFGGYWLYRTRVASSAATATSGTYTQVVTAEQGNLTATLSVVGQLEAVRSADLTFEHMSGTTQVLSLTVAAGNTVTAGQVLATIDPAQYHQALDQAKGDLQAAEENLADLKTAATVLQIAQADVTVAKAQQALEQAKADLADLEAPDLTSLRNAVQDAQDNLDLFQLQALLAERDSLAKSERDLQYAVAWHQRRIAELQQLVAAHQANLEQTEQIATEQETLGETQADLARVQAERALHLQARAAELARDKAALADAQEALAKAKAGGDKVALAQANVAVQQAQVSLESAQEARAKLDAGADSSAVATAQATVDKRRLAVSDAETALAGTTLVAPFDATVLESYVTQGDQVTANSIVLTLANLKSLQVVASVDETTIRQVSAGQDAVISFDAFPGQTFKGKVLSVPLQGTLQGGVTVYEVPLSLSGAEKLSLLVGMTANVEVQVGSVTNALLVPALALQKVNGAYQVSVPNTMDPAGQPETVPVEVGLSNGTYTQIIRGLNAGDQVIVTIQSTQSSGFRSFGGASSGSSGIFRMFGAR